MVKLGMIGMGGIAGCHLNAYEKLAGKAQIVACCDNILERANGTAERAAINNGYGAGTTKLQVKAYTDYRELLADPTIEAVDICLPTYLHAEVSIAALQAGKHVMSEKPMALTVEDCDRMVAAAQETGRILMIGQCIRFWPEYLCLKEIVDSGKYGKVLGASFSRISGRPRTSVNNWMLNPALSGGGILDLHIHDTDFVAFLFGVPKSVSTRGREDEIGIGFVRTEYGYDDADGVIAEGGWDHHDGFPFFMTFLVQLEKATVLCHGAWGPLTVFPAEGESFTPELLPGDGYSRELDYFLDCVTNGKLPTVVTPWQARETVRIIAAEAESLHAGREIAL